ncbi:UvrD-helicase domain-containing protein [Alloiococcus sp. CFN-8]|uniref:UvrD-helicase domain-containing protein n=1 Tax=Alloiococcus sp. CFN-8 TaxID=3416081 RepID=UPI003CEB955B
MNTFFGIDIRNSFTRISYIKENIDGIYTGICTNRGESFSTSLGISNDFKGGYIGSGVFHRRAELKDYTTIDSFIDKLLAGSSQKIGSALISPIDIAYLYFFFLKEHIKNFYGYDLTNAVVSLEDSYYKNELIDALNIAFRRVDIESVLFIKSSEAQLLGSHKLLKSCVERESYIASIGAASLGYISGKENLIPFIKDSFDAHVFYDFYESCENPLIEASKLASMLKPFSEKPDKPSAQSLTGTGDNDHSKSAKDGALETKTSITGTAYTKIKEAGYTRITTPSPIIEAEIEERIIVNAGPGTGKTYSVIQRLAYIINEGLADPQNILVLCYSRAAVAVVRDRLTQEIKADRLADEAYQLFNNIRTFDSFATYMMAEDLEEGILNSLDYDGRIDRFVEELKKDPSALEGLKYLIVDELQDIVGPRANMVKEILNSINCGFMLLGDKCQAIYDYLIEDEEELNSVRFYNWLQEEYSETSIKYELIKNQRQNSSMTKLSSYLREAILSNDFDLQEEAFKKCRELLMIGGYRGELGETLYKKEDNLAILCRNNGEAALVSSILYKDGINHKVLRSAQHLELVPWIGELLGNYGEDKIGHNAFIERLELHGYEDRENKWRLLKSLAQDENERVLDLKLLTKELVRGKEIPEGLNASGNENIIVSTIHKGKGREFNHIALLVRDFTLEEKGGHDLVDFGEELKVAYVALTRTKGGMSFYDLPTRFTKQLPSKRWIGFWFSKKSKKRFCSNIEIGYPEDVDYYSFVRGSREEVERKQTLIASLNKGCELEARLNGSSYDLYYENQCLGSLSKTINKELWSAKNELGAGGGLPNRLTGIYVDNVITIANTRYDEEILKEYNKSGLWLGLQLSAFARVEFD